MYPIVRFTNALPRVLTLYFGVHNMEQPEKNKQAAQLGMDDKVIFPGKTFTCYNREYTKDFSVAIAILPSAF